MSEIIEKFIQWLDANGYYIGCYGYQLKEKEVKQLILDFDWFKVNKIDEE